MQDCSLLEKNLIYLQQFIGKVMVCTLKNGTKFSAMLESVGPSGMLVFRNSRGKMFTDMAQDVVGISEYKKKSEIPKTTRIQEV